MRARSDSERSKRCGTVVLAFLFLLVCDSPAICDLPEVPTPPCGTSRVYVKIFLPMKEPAEGTHSVVESWIAKKLRKRGNTELRAVTPWVPLAEEGEKVAPIWNAIVDGKLWGCPVVGRVVDRTADDKVMVQLSGWSPDVAKIERETLPAETGSRRIAVVDDGRAYVALLVAPPLGEANLRHAKEAPPR